MSSSMDSETKQMFTCALAFMEAAKGKSPFYATRNGLMNPEALADIVERDKSRRSAWKAGARWGSDQHGLQGAIVGGASGLVGGGVGWVRGRFGTGAYHMDREQSQTEAENIGGATGAAIGAAGVGALAAPMLLLGPIGLIGIGAAGAIGGVRGWYVGRGGGNVGGQVGFENGWERRRGVPTAIEEIMTDVQKKASTYSKNFPVYMAENLSPRSTVRDISKRGGKVQCQGCQIDFPQDGFKKSNKVKLLTMDGDGLWPRNYVGIARVVYLEFANDLEEPANFRLDSKCSEYTAEDHPIDISVFYLSRNFTWAEIPFQAFEGHLIKFQWGMPGVIIAVIKNQWKGLARFDRKELA